MSGDLKRDWMVRRIFELVQAGLKGRKINGIHEYSFLSPEGDYYEEDN